MLRHVSSNGSLCVHLGVKNYDEMYRQASYRDVAHYLISPTWIHSSLQMSQSPPLTSKQCIFIFICHSTYLFLGNNIVIHCYSVATASRTMLQVSEY